MAYNVQNDPWKSQHSITVGTETETARISAYGVPDGNNYTLYLDSGVNNMIFQHQSGEIRWRTSSSTDIVLSPANVEAMRVEHTTGRIGIGTSSPNTALHVAGTIYSGATESNTIFSGSAAGQVNQNLIGSNGYWSIRTATDESFNLDVYNSASAITAMTVLQNGKVGLGTNSPYEKLEVVGCINVNGAASVNYTSAVTMGFDNAGANIYSFGADSSTYGKFRLTAAQNDGSPLVRMAIDADGDTGIGTTSPSYKLEVNGTFYSSGSSMDYKQEVQDYKPDADAIMNLRPVHYEYIDDYKHFGKRLENNSPQIGLVAEEVAEVMPELAVMKEEDGKDVVRNVDYEKLTVVLLSELQELKREVKALKEEN